MKYFLLLFFIFNISNIYSQPKSIVFPIAFYNVENLFDTKRDQAIQDEEFTPSGKYHWTADRYQKKLNNLAHVISELGQDANSDGFAILGLAEVENRKVIEDLIKTSPLDKKKYEIVHEDSPDTRGIDVGLIYNPRFFKLLTHKTYPFTAPGKRKSRTRDILVVSGMLDGEPLTILVNHWVSRRGKDSAPVRQIQAQICKRICDSLYKENPALGIIIMGDFNDNPDDKSVSIALGAKRNIVEVKTGGLYNTMWKVYDKGIGSLRYHDKWDLFDQIIVSESLLKQGKSKLSFNRSYVFNKKYLFQQAGRFKGHPLRTFSGTAFLNGYSDHFPTLIYLTK